MRCIVLLLAVLSVVNCTKNFETESRKNGKLFAVVDTSALYDSVLISQFPFLAECNDFIKSGYVKKWADNRLILKAIYESGFDKRPHVDAKLEKLKEDFLINEYMKYQTNRQKISSEHLERLYYKNMSDYLIKENEYKYQLIYFDRKDHANEVYKIMDDEKVFNLANLSSDVASLVVQKELIGSFTRESAIVSTDVIEKLKDLRVGGFSKPVKHGDAYIIVKLIDKRLAGEPYPMNEVMGRILLKEYGNVEKKIFKQLVDSIKLYSDVKMYIDGESK